jgi:hypothetical protein
MPLSMTPEECLSELSLPSPCEELKVDHDELSMYGLHLEDCPRGAVDCDAARTLLSPASKGGIPAIAASIIETLQTEKAELDARIRTIMLERDSLLCDRANLEQANTILRQANLEKDQQMAALLIKVGTPAPSLQSQLVVVSPTKLGLSKCAGCCRMMQLGRGTEDCPLCQAR